MLLPYDLKMYLRGLIHRLFYIGKTDLLSKWKTFVSHRVAFIQQNLTISCWGYVDSIVIESTAQN